MISLLKSWLKPLLVMVSTYTGIRQTNSQPRINILDFPPEVLRMVFVEVGRPEREFLPLNYHSEEAWFRREQYRELCLTCSHFLGEARRLLFSEMRSHLGSTQFKFLSIILRKPEYAAYVRIYHTPSRPHEQQGYLLGEIQKALKIMYSLKELVIREPYPEDTPRTRCRTKAKLKRILPAPLAAAAKQAMKDGKTRYPFQLHRFVWLSRTRDPKEALDFLTTQSRLEYLGWGVETPIPPKYARKVSRKLIRLDATTPVIEALLPGRRITELQWNITDWDVPDTIQKTHVQNVLKMPEFKELRVLSLLDVFRDDRKKRGTKLLQILRKMDIGPFPKLEVMFNHAACLTGPNSTHLVKQDVPYLTLFPGLKHYLMVQLAYFDKHVCLGSNFGELLESTVFLTHDHDMCENGTFLVEMDRLYSKYSTRDF